MPIVPTYPGVYIEELASQSLSIATGNTAVPVFAVGDRTDPNNSTVGSPLYGSGGPDYFFPETKKINSWLEFEKALTYSHTGGAEASAYSPENPLHVAVKAYFLNGGNYCYLIRADKLVTEVPKLDDVTLLLASGLSSTGTAMDGGWDFTDNAGVNAFNEAVVTLCLPGSSLFAILDGPYKEVAGTGDTALYPGESFAAAYYPWLTADWAQTLIPPSGAVAGAYCTVDRDRGVWKAPANVALKGGLVPKYKVSDTTQGDYNTGKALNMIREFQDSGTLIWGARTLDDSDDWRYVPVRRLFSSAEKDIKKTMQSMVFEPNSQATWERVRGAVDNYLRKLWQQGGLLGNSEKEAYFVQIGKGITMTDDDIRQGKMIVNVGMAAVRPAEFIILQFTQSVNQG